LIQIPITIENLEWDLTENGQKVVSFKIGVEQEKRKTAKNSSFSSAIPDIKTKTKDDNYEPEKFKLKTQLTIQEEPEEKEEPEEEEEEENKSEVSSEDSYSDNDEPPRPKITIHPNLLPDGKIGATEATRMGFKIELVKGELIAKDPRTGETYKVTSGK
jgi:hypothetical protein